MSTSYQVSSPIDGDSHQPGVAIGLSGLPGLRGGVDEYLGKVLRSKRCRTTLLRQLPSSSGLGGAGVCGPGVGDGDRCTKKTDGESGGGDGDPTVPEGG